MKFLLAPCHPSVVLGGAFLFFAAFESVPAMAVLLCYFLYISTATKQPEPEVISADDYDIEDED
jgi:hypothetical protein